ncbi:cytochrome P450 [Mycena galopus ATCC 62051]|nr:cytochrome P450 [Mycena galopus ATCC 62051]
MQPIFNLILPMLATAALCFLLRLAELIYHDLSSPVRNLVGPKNSSYIFGNLDEMDTREVYTADTLAIGHIVKNNFIYQRRAAAQSADTRFAGEGLLGVEGDVHKRQNPAFGTAQIRGLTEVFVEKSLRDVWIRQIGGNSRPTRIDVLDWLSKMTLDVIGQAGFDYQLGSLNGDEKSKEIHDTFHKLFRSVGRARRTAIFRSLSTIRFLKYLPVPGRKTVSEGRKTLFSMGSQILVNGKAAIVAAGGPKAVSGKRDIFSLVLGANMSADILDNHRMSDDEVIGQIPTFFVAGHATTSSAIAWALYELAVNPPLQTKLREELFTLPTDNPTLEELNSLPYLDSVIRETLRVHAPVSFVARIAAMDDVLPLGTPCFDTQGRKLTCLQIRKGQTVRIPIVDVNTDITLWGKDAAEFRPERWEEVPKAVEEIPAIWGNMLTFLAGPHNCIGFRFSLAEQKALLFVLVRAFEFHKAGADGDIRRSGSGLQAPFVHNEREKGSQMPLMVKSYQA